MMSPHNVIFKSHIGCTYFCSVSCILHSMVTGYADFYYVLHLHTLEKLHCDRQLSLP